MLCLMAPPRPRRSRDRGGGYCNSLYRYRYCYSLFICQKLGLHNIIHNITIDSTALSNLGCESRAKFRCRFALKRKRPAYTVYQKTYALATLSCTDNSVNLLYFLEHASPSICQSGSCPGLSLARRRWLSMIVDVTLQGRLKTSRVTCKIFLCFMTGI